MKCDEIKDMLELYALGLLDPEEKREIDEHLRGACEPCNRGLKDALAMNAMVMGSVASAPPPRRLKRRVLAGVGIEPKRWGWLGLLATAAMVVVAMWLGVQERERSRDLADARQSILQITSERDRLEQALSYLDEPETKQVNFGGAPRPPRGKVFVNSRKGVLIVVSNLPKLPAGKAFEMWLIPKGGSPRPAGVFQPSRDGSGMNFISGPVDIASLGAVAVSIEPASGSNTPTEVIAVADTAGS